MNLDTYLDELIKNGLDKNHWFVTKQTMSDFYFPFYIGKIVESYDDHHYPNENYASYYTRCFKENIETSTLYPRQCISENTYRNSIIAEFVGLIDRSNSRYADAVVTEAYNCIKKYVNSYDDIETNKEIIDRQIEKLCLNVIHSQKYDDVKDVTIFPVIFLYKIMLELYEKYKDSTLTYDEFSLFAMRTAHYSDYNTVLDLIEQYRNHSYNSNSEKRIYEILQHQSTLNVRFDALIGSLRNIEYHTHQYFRINNTTESYEYIRSVVHAYENSIIFNENNKDKLKEFMQSKQYFTGELDNVNLKRTVTQEEFTQLIKKEDLFFEDLIKLAEKYGEEGTTEITSTVRLSSVQHAFRDKLIEKYGKKCSICNIVHNDLLIASHIKEAASCNIYEKADFNNGLLLCAMHDKLFDKFLITFNFYDGKIQISKSISDEERIICGLNDDICLTDELLTPERCEYLMWHNEEFHKKESEL